MHLESQFLQIELLIKDLLKDYRLNYASLRVFAGIVVYSTADLIYRKVVLLSGCHVKVVPF